MPVLCFQYSKQSIGVTVSHVFNRYACLVPWLGRSEWKSPLTLQQTTNVRLKSSEVQPSLQLASAPNDTKWTVGLHARINIVSQERINLRNRNYGEGQKLLRRKICLKGLFLCLPSHTVSKTEGSTKQLGLLSLLC